MNENSQKKLEQLDKPRERKVIVSVAIPSDVMQVIDKMAGSRERSKVIADHLTLGLQVVNKYPRNRKYEGIMREMKA
jgi:metal-responsive CopG/Arc/MetJ family transcriptional regulator